MKYAARLSSSPDEMIKNLNDSFFTAYEAYQDLKFVEHLWERSGMISTALLDGHDSPFGSDPLSDEKSSVRGKSEYDAVSSANLPLDEL